MSERSQDWLKQAKRDLSHVKNSGDVQDYEWACFAAQQVSEKALKVLYQIFLFREVKKGIILS
jgi:HEPN domain-containing protein